MLANYIYCMVMVIHCFYDFVLKYFQNAIIEIVQTLP